MEEITRIDPSHLLTTIKVARNEDLFEQIGRDIFFDLVDHDNVCSFCIWRRTPFYTFKKAIAREFGIPVEFQRFWLWGNRQNHTYRPKRPLTVAEEAQSVGQINKVGSKANESVLNLFLEIELGPDMKPISLPVKTSAEILLYFKLYDPLKEEIRFVGSLFVNGGRIPAEILTKLNEMASFGAEELDLFEEIKFKPNVMCKFIDQKTTFRDSQLEDGDIICFQKSRTGNERYRYPDVPSFLEYVRNLQVVRFRSLEKPKEDEFLLELSKLHTYDDVVEKVAQHLGLDDPSKIRLTSHNCYSQQPKPQPIKYRGVDHLSDMLVHYNQTSDILYYEILDIPLPEFQGLKTLKVAFHHATKDEVVIHTVRLPKQSTVGDVIIDLKTKVELSNPDVEIRLLEVFHHKIFKIFPINEKIENINDQYWTLRAEEIPEEEKYFGPQDRLIHVYHFMKDTSQNQQVQKFGQPFFLVIRKDETLVEVKARLQKKLQIFYVDYAKLKFVFLSLGRPEYIQDSYAVASRFQTREQCLGLEHSDNSPKRSYSTIQEIADAEKFFEQCLNMDLTSVIQSGKAPEFKNSLSTLLTQKSFLINKTERTTKIVADFVKSCEQYEIAQQNLSEAQKHENLVCEIKTTLRQLYSKFMPVRNLAEAVDQEIARLEKQLTKRKAQKVELIKKLEDLNTQATTSNEALVSGVKKLKRCTVNKEEAEKIINDFELSWQFLKDLRNQQA